MSSDQDRQRALEDLQDLLAGAGCPFQGAAAQAVVANVETVIRAAGGEVRTAEGTTLDSGFVTPALMPSEEVTHERTVYVMPWRKVTTDEQREGTHVES